MQQGKVYRNSKYIGKISKDTDAMYHFSYSSTYLENEDAVAISVNLPLQKEDFYSDELFAFFFNMLAEGNIKALQCKEFKIDEDDHFTRLLKTTASNTIGAITVEENKREELGRGLGELLGELEDAYANEGDRS